MGKTLLALQQLIIAGILLVATTANAQFYSWRYRYHATDCTSLTDGRPADLCFEADDQKLYKCETTDNLCDTASEWKLVSGQTYTAGGTLLQLSGTTFSVKEGTLTDGKACTYSTSSGIICNSTFLTTEVDGSTTNELQNIFQSVSDGTNTATADTTTDTLRFRSSDNSITITVTNDDATYGDVVDLVAVGGSSGDITAVGSCASGDCFVDGTNNTLTFEGATNDLNEIILQSADPTADRTITLPDETGTVCTTGSVCSGYESETHASEHEAGGADPINHDNLTGFVANEHIDHSAVTITAGAGLSGGGDITASRTLQTASQEAGFLADGGVTNLTCGAGNAGKVQVMDDGSIQYCDGAATSVLRSGFLDADGVDDTGTDTLDDLSDNSLNDLNDVTITTPSNGQVLKYNGTAWINGTDNDTTYTAGGTLLQLSGTQFSIKEGTLTDTKACTYSATSGIVCNSTFLTSEVDGDTTNELQNIFQSVTDGTNTATADTTTDTLRFRSSDGSISITVTNDDPTYGDVINLTATGGGGGAPVGAEYIVAAADATLTNEHNVGKTDDTVIVANGTTWEAKTLPSCTDTGGNHLNYDPSTNTFSCGTSGDGKLSTTGSVELSPNTAHLVGAFITMTPTGGDAASGGAQINGGDGVFKLLFDAATDEAAVWQLTLPKDYSSTPKLAVTYAMTSATTGTVEFEGAIRCITSGDAEDVDAASGFSSVATATETVPATAGYVKTLTITLNDDACAAGDLAIVYLSTDANDATNDTATGDREVLSVQFIYTRS